MKKTDAFGKAIPFDIAFRTFNRNNKKGGVLTKYKSVRLLIKDQKTNAKNIVNAAHFYKPFRQRKDPNHWDNRTRNIELANGMIRKINIMYITSFNGKDVIY